MIKERFCFKRGNDNKQTHKLILKIYLFYLRFYSEAVSGVYGLWRLISIEMKIGGGRRWGIDSNRGDR